MSNAKMGAGCERAKNNMQQHYRMLQFMFNTRDRKTYLHHIHLKLNVSMCTVYTEMAAVEW